MTTSRGARSRACKTYFAHEYFEIDLAEVRAAVDKELPGLKASISEILARG